ncbi:MAG: indole-3-glycerol phosphate synthase TrpC [Chloroflexi bacterium]|nr:indole-3-glycerol phosphate synthase TrpC [Chloroflexota bacterium]
MILDDILAHKATEIAAAKARLAPAEVRARAEAEPPPLDFAAALRRGSGPVRLIAEVKRASPSRGVFGSDLDPSTLAAIYAANGAAAISVLTDERFFHGTLADLTAVKTRAAGPAGVPVLRKDFVVDPYQVWEARAAGADAILLIVAALDDARLRDLRILAEELGMAALVEGHDEAEIDRALATGATVVGINNRDLRTFQVDLATTERLRPRIPAGCIAGGLSGIHSRADVERLAAAGVDAVLVGEALVRSADVAAKVRELACCE